MRTVTALPSVESLRSLHWDPSAFCTTSRTTTEEARMSSESTVDMIAAVTAARKNFRTGGVKRMVRLARGTLPHHLAPERRFDLAVANISSRVVMQQAEHLHPAIKPGGTLIVSGFIRGQSEQLGGLLAGFGFHSTQVYCIEDWVALSFTREG